MKRTHKAPRIPEYVRRVVLIATILLTVAVGLMTIVQQFFLYYRISEQKRESLIGEHKQFIKDLIAIEMEYISNRKVEFDKRIKEELSHNVIEAHQVASALYDRYHGQLSKAEMLNMIVEAVSSLHSFSKYAHVFINKLDGRGVYYYGNPGFTGKNLSELKDKNGNYVIQSELNLLKSKDEGFLVYWNEKLEDDESLNDKIAFVKQFPEMGIYFGAKCYMEDYYEQFKDEIAHKISSARFRYGGYIFLNELRGDPVVLNGEIYEGDFNFFADTTTHSYDVFMQEVDAATSSSEGGYFNYYWNKIGENERSEKISYARYYKPCDWIVGAGFYVDDIDSELVSENRDLKNGLLWNILQIFVILAFTVALELYFLYRFKGNFLADSFQFTRFFKLGKGGYELIDVDNIHFMEFRNMAYIANEMIEERKRVYEQLISEQDRAREADRLKTAFLANMSHEIRTPMNAILGFSELLGDEEIDPEVHRDFVKLIRQNGEMLLTLINDIIDIAKIESGQLTIMKDRFKLDSLLNELQSHFNGILERQNNSRLKFKLVNLAPADFECYTDEFRLKQVLYNLIGNAIKFTPSGFVRVEVRLKAERVCFKVIDSGIGISDEDIETIFERFIQAHDHLQKKYGGTGLGLAISKNIVELLGGKIWVNSVEGKGSEFEFYITSEEK